MGQASEMLYAQVVGSSRFSFSHVAHAQLTFCQQNPPPCGCAQHAHLTDLKPANCLIDPQGCVKIADMNISKVSKGGNMQVFVLSPPPLSPRSPLP